MKDIVGLIPTWLTSRHALGAWRSLRKYYPELPIFIIDDKYNEKDRNIWMKYYKDPGYKPGSVFDPDSSKLVSLYKTAFIQQEHVGDAPEGHGRALDFVMRNFIHTKWIFHLSSDTRIIKPGIIEFLLDGVDDKCCCIGFKRTTNNNLPSVGKWACIWRGDLLHKYPHLNFFANLNIPCDTGSEFFAEMVKKGYYLKYVNHGILSEYCFHIRYYEENKDLWEKYY